MSAAYIIAKAMRPGVSLWSDDCFRRLLRSFEGELTTEVVSEIETAGLDGSSEITLLVDGPSAPERVSARLAQVEYSPNESVQIAVLEKNGVMEYPHADIGMTYYRLNRPDTEMVSHTDCNVQAVHIPTGIAAKSERSRSRLVNLAEALALLRSKLWAREK
ncbi:MAG: hypothetical protein IPH54_11000 [Rhodoferax sp.]|jgi:protein subunit release factor B|nr:hypothetical protein [Rhodoferax sp.]